MADDPQAGNAGTSDAPSKHLGPHQTPVTPPATVTPCPGLPPLMPPDGTQAAYLLQQVQQEVRTQMQAVLQQCKQLAGGCTDCIRTSFNAIVQGEKQRYANIAGYIDDALVNLLSEVLQECAVVNVGPGAPSAPAPISGPPQGYGPPAQTPPAAPGMPTTYYPKYPYSTPPATAPAAPLPPQTLPATPNAPPPPGVPVTPNAPPPVSPPPVAPPTPPATAPQLSVNHVIVQGQVECVDGCTRPVGDEFLIPGPITLTWGLATYPAGLTASGKPLVAFALSNGIGVTVPGHFRMLAEPPPIIGAVGTAPANPGYRPPTEADVTGQPCCDTPPAAAPPPAPGPDQPAPTPTPPADQAACCPQPIDWTDPLALAFYQKDQPWRRQAVEWVGPWYGGVVDAPSLRSVQDLLRVPASLTPVDESWRDQSPPSLLPLLAQP